MVNVTQVPIKSSLPIGFGKPFAMKSNKTANDIIAKYNAGK